MTNRKMLILWHWSQIQEKNGEKNTDDLADSIAVAQKSINEVCQREIIILDEGDRVPKKIIFNIPPLIARSKDDPIKPQYLIFLHKDSLDRRGFTELENELVKAGLGKDQFKLISFGGGDHFIYYKKLTDTGLLDQFGGFMDGDCKNINDENDNWDFRSVWTKPTNTDRQVIKAEAFDQVWNYYNSRCKKLLYEFQEQLLTYFITIEKFPQEEVKLSAFLEQNDPQLKEELDKICSEEENMAEQVRQIYGTKTISNYYDELVNYIRATSFNSTNEKNYLYELRHKFHKLLQEMPESVY